MSTPAVIFVAPLLPSVMGRSSFHLSPHGARIRLQTHAAQGTARGIGLLIPSKVELEVEFSEIRRDGVLGTKHPRSCWKVAHRPARRLTSSAMIRGDSTLSST